MRVEKKVHYSVGLKVLLKVHWMVERRVGMKVEKKVHHSVH